MVTVNDILAKMRDINVINHNEYVKRVELLAQEMINAEFALVWVYTKESNVLSTVNGVCNDITLNSSIMKGVFDTKKAFYTNHIVSHKSYNSAIDNPLSLSLKSMMVLPILDKEDINCIGFITAFNSTKSSHLFKRYDIKILEALLPYGRISLNKALYLPEENSLKKMVTVEDSANSEKEVRLMKEELLKKELEIQELKEQIENMELFQELDMVSQEEADFSVKELLTSTTEKKVLPVSKYEIEIFKDSQAKLHEQISNDINFMLNELTYLSQDEYNIYHFLELIKNSLHDKSQLQYIEKVLKNKDFLYGLTSDYYKSRKIRVVCKEINVMYLFEDIVNLYSLNMSNSNLTFNIFINPHMPKYLLLDKDLIQSIVVPLINNIYAFTNEMGAIEILINYDYTLEVLRCKIHGISEKKLTMNIRKIFKKEELENTLGINRVGLGLSISTNLIKLLKGTLEINKSERDGESFSFSIPAENFLANELMDSLTHLESLKIGILMDERNKYASINLLRYLEAFGIAESKIFFFSDHKEYQNISLTHLFCFDNMLHKEMELDGISSFTILKYDLYKNYKEYLERDSINELYLNFHYGRKLKKLLFPHIIDEDAGYKTLIIEEKLSSRFKNNFLNKLLG